MFIFRRKVKLKMKIYIIDPKKKPEEVEFNITDDLCISIGDLNEINEFGSIEIDINSKYVDSYIVARKYIEEYNKNNGYEEHPFIQRVSCLPWKNLGLYVDDSGRVNGQEANRKILFNDGNGSIFSIEICGRLVVIPEIHLYGCAITTETDSDINRQLYEFMHYNNNDGLNDLQLFTNKDASVNNSVVTSFDFDSINDFWKFLNGLK